MEFAEAVKIANRMCEIHKRCIDCPAYGKCIRSVSFKFDDEHIKDYEAMLDKWNKGQLAKTT